MWRKAFADQNLEFFHHRVGNRRSFFLGERLLQRSALVHGGSGDYSTFIGYSLHSDHLAGSKFHKSSYQCNMQIILNRSPEGTIITIQIRPCHPPKLCHPERSEGPAVSRLWQKAGPSLRSGSQLVGRFTCSPLRTRLSPPLRHCRRAS